MAKRELTITEREHIAENMKERVYSTITLLAVIAAHWQAGNGHSVKATAFAIAGSALALWLATLVAVRMSYRAVHGRRIKTSEYRHLAFTSSGLLVPAVAPIILVLVSATGLYDLTTGLMASMVILLLELFVLSFVAGRKIYDSLPRLILVSALEMSVGVGVILLKLAVGE